jgi:hypothetical protein
MITIGKEIVRIALIKRKQKQKNQMEWKTRGGWR